MKTYKNLYDKFISRENIELAIGNSFKNKKKTKKIQKMLSDKESLCDTMYKFAVNYKHYKHNEKEIYDGISRKKRIIIIPSNHEQILHHMIMNILIPILAHGMYEHSYSSIPNRGAHKAKKQIEKWIKHDKKNVKYCLKMDIRKFFPSVSTTILKEKLARIIKDDKFLAIVNEVIDTTDRGIPIGFYTSQWFANWYLTELDHYIKENLGVVHYVRYADDMVLFGSNKKKLHSAKLLIEKFLNGKLDLTLKDNWQVFRFSYLKGNELKGRYLDFMGFKFYRNKTILRKSIMLKCTRKARKIGKEEKPNIYEIRQMLSYIGWLNCTDTYNMYLKCVKPYVNIRYCKKRVSRYNRNINSKERRKSHGLDKK